MHSVQLNLRIYFLSLLNPGCRRCCNYPMPIDELPLLKRLSL